ncbi:hypothetical protein PLESTB_001413700 [Pleodorina starrii]|uniref:Protein phosphatase inhibitor 2 n=1 Tax=Pleodorina starrii TaxID=330485 RepID=A0A9W6F731_9CHLO|nr:hypothetical protein PLESTM_001375100 [Pleodorina starrii]GLC58887.1 hypothetical protein PLESTB_001413700 [Pleodorina starrii]GLC65044.1 hypothetical protein PLESTF_000240500 [Pleodorina starrii]
MRKAGSARKRPAGGISWDEQNLQENEVIKATISKTKIDEPKTPYHGPLGDQHMEEADDGLQPLELDSHHNHHNQPHPSLEAPPLAGGSSGNSAPSSAGAGAGDGSGGTAAAAGAAAAGAAEPMAAAAEVAGPAAAAAAAAEEVADASGAGGSPPGPSGSSDNRQGLGPQPQGPQGQQQHQQQQGHHHGHAHAGLHAHFESSLLSSDAAAAEPESRSGFSSDSERRASLTGGSDGESNGEEAKRKFQQRRKAHYNMRAALRRARVLLSEDGEGEPDAVEDEDSGSGSDGGVAAAEATAAAQREPRGSPDVAMDDAPRQLQAGGEGSS